MKEKINNLDISSILFLQLFSCSLGIAPYIHKNNRHRRLYKYNNRYNYRYNTYTNTNIYIQLRNR